MRRIGRTKHLSCFYCGKQTGLNQSTKHTNTLLPPGHFADPSLQYGDITDPPVATDREAAAPSQFARPQHATTTAAPDAVFCEKCLKNQRLFTASLAQYLPDDPSHPEYEELDRNYYRYRRNLERRYPQVCDGCADRVQQRIQQAGYTAKTDHLRRMMDKSRGRRSAAGATTRRAGVLDAASALGGWLWRGGLAAQLLWHALRVIQALERPDDGMYDPDDAGVYATTLAVAAAAAAWLPGGDALMRLSIAAAVLSSWWNPHFVQFSRGFTRHLLGFTRWYSFQGLIVFLRIFFRSVLSMEGGAAQSQGARLSAHLATAGIMCFIYIMASRSIRVDTTPLFKSEDKPPTPRRNMSPAKRKEEDSKTFSELFNEALDSTPRKGRPSPSLPATPGTPNYASGSAFVPPSQIKLMQEQQRRRGFHDSPPLASPSAFQPRAQQAPIVHDYDDGDAMDWSPSQPQHRAFRDTPDRSTAATARRPFGQSPTHADDGGGSANPFWFKVPPAPTTPARQLRNPPNMPVLRQKPAERDDVFFSASLRGERDGRSSRPSSGGGGGGTSFRNPSFFAPEENDEANSLADLLGESFTLGRRAQAQEQRQPRRGRPAPAALSSTPSSPSCVERRRADPQRVRGVRPRPVELVVLAVLLPLWLLPSFVTLPARATGVLQGIVPVAAGVVALGGTHHELNDEAGPRQQRSRLVVDAALSALGVGELAAVCWVGWETWTAGVDVRAYGAGVLAVMLAHHAVRLLRA
ncbi:hypothetical protein ISF_03113 [Cordyceps fumosorosea ARSEF 2679]|uniref:Ima1 N-terminal domain-containing protein n=1 Tax=Cordyceps fumosorosea (strain ARSEF 2679) TaxID=1081104 RepID=A0A168BAB5_CORFA|nr:hypothetical protein ISF_03113 [Cordyceps fumosorosea ARSEF 2679]OAA69843.1 hypothetical protein ISF_03113 [Cordyceps fumosorosea ARSEF 2679]